MWGDPRVKKRQQVQRGWYALMAAIDIVQGAGRSIRNATDVAPTYILDSKWLYWYPANEHIFPEYFRAAVRPFSARQLHQRTGYAIGENL
jgi:hypothetical protein